MQLIILPPAPLVHAHMSTRDVRFLNFHLSTVVIFYIFFLSQHKRHYEKGHAEKTETEREERKKNKRDRDNKKRVEEIEKQSENEWGKWR